MGQSSAAAPSTAQLEELLLEKFTLAGLQAERKEFTALKGRIVSTLTPEEEEHLMKFRRKVLSRGYAAKTKKGQKDSNADDDEMGRAQQRRTGSTQKSGSRSKSKKPRN